MFRDMTLGCKYDTKMGKKDNKIKNILSFILVKSSTIFIFLIKESDSDFEVDEKL